MFKIFPGKVPTEARNQNKTLNWQSNEWNKQTDMISEPVQMACATYITNSLIHGWCVRNNQWCLCTVFDDQ